MKKICPKCHRVQQDERIVACEICKEPFVSMADGVRLLSNEEIATLASAIFKDWRIKLLLKAFPVVVLAGVAAAALFLNWSAAKRLKVATAEIEQTSSNEVARALMVATNQLAYQFKIFANDASNQVVSAYSAVTNQIAEEFQTARIKQTVETVAKDEAKLILETNVQPVVAAFRSDVESKLAAIDETVKKGNATVTELQTYIVFSKTASAAQNDDRPAFDQLKAWSEDKNYSFEEEAKQTWIKILDEHASLFVTMGFTVPWSEGVDPSKLSFEELKSGYRSAPPQIRIALVEYIWNRKDISKRNRMQFLVDVIKTDKSLKVVEHAARFFSQESKDKLKPLAVEQHIEWWEKNKDSIKE